MIRRGQNIKKRVPDDIVAAMHRAHMAGESLTSVARRHGRSGSALRNIFDNRGLPMRRAPGGSSARDPVTGRVMPAPEPTAAQIRGMIDRATRIGVPPELRVVWRRWPLARRADFIARLRTRLQPPDARPVLPFSSNVTPFDYGTPEAWEIINRLNAGLSSRQAVARLLPCSQGVMHQGTLYFWTRKAGYVEGCPWSPERTRPLLTHVIWSQAHGTTVPPSHVLRFADGNPNNLDPANLILASRNDLARENQSAALRRKSREHTAALLRHTQTTHENDTLTTLRRRSAARRG